MSQKTTTRRLPVAVGCMATLELQCYNCSSELELLEAFVRELACRIIVRVKMTVLFTIYLFALQNLKSGKILGRHLPFDLCCLVEL